MIVKALALPQLPAALPECTALVRKIIGPSFGYVEEAGLDRTTKVWTWKVTPSVLADRSKISGTIQCEPLGADRCRVTFAATINIKVIGLSGIIESTGEKSTRASWTDFMTAFESGLCSASDVARSRDPGSAEPRRLTNGA